MKNQNQENKTTHSHGRRLLMWSVLIGIFVCGVMAGAFIWQKHANTANSGTDIVIDEDPLLSCEMKENALLANLIYNIDDSNTKWAAEAHEHNAHIYDRLVRWGCEENSEKYKNLRDAEYGAFDVLSRLEEINEAVKPCTVIENQLKYKLSDSRPDTSSFDHARNATIYSKMVMVGCPENKSMYTEKALGELQIADGIRVWNDSISNEETVYTVNAYKNLGMKKEAQEYIQKIRRLLGNQEVLFELQHMVEE